MPDAFGGTSEGPEGGPPYRRTLLTSVAVRPRWAAKQTYDLASARPVRIATSQVIREKFNFRAPWQARTQAMINPK
jgi:hypothetical protein